MMFQPVDGGRVGCVRPEPAADLEDEVADDGTDQIIVLKKR